jgi:hypothetical protein
VITLSIIFLPTLTTCSLYFDLLIGSAERAISQQYTIDRRMSHACQSPGSHNRRGSGTCSTSAVVHMATSKVDEAAKFSLLGGFRSSATLPEL